MSRVLVAGGCGFIGSHLCERLLRRADVEVCVVVDNLWTGLIDNIGRLSDPRLHFVQNDVERFESDTFFDEIYHLASPATPPWYMKEPRRTISANVVGAMRLLDLLVPGGRFAYTSTSEVYGESHMSPQPEHYRGSVDCTGPRSSYDEGKRCTEALLFETRRTRGIDLRVVRLFNVYGPHTRPDDGRAVSNFLAQALAGKPLTIYGDGLQSRSWGYIDDILDALERFFWLDAVQSAGPLNIGNDRAISVLEIAQYISALFGGLPIQHLDPVPQDPSIRCPDLTLARQLLPGWACAVQYEEGIRRTAAWFRARARQSWFCPPTPGTAAFEGGMRP